MIIVSSTGEEILVDKEDHEELSRWIWHIDDKGYAYKYVYRGRSGRKKRRAYMHRLLHKTKDPKNFVDHWDRNRLNNTRGNLREKTPAQNARNRRKSHGKSKYKGVIILDQDSPIKYRSVIGFNHQQINIGIFDDEIHAALAYDFWARKLDPDHFVMNFKDNHPQYNNLASMLNSEGYYRPPKRKRCDDVPGTKIEFRGVKYLKDKDSFAGIINYKGKRFKLGTRKLPEEAALIYDSAARILYNTKAILNFPDKDPVPHIVEKAKKILSKLGPKKETTTNKIITDKEMAKLKIK